MDFLPVESVTPTDEIKEMYWRYGQRILAAGMILARTPDFTLSTLPNFPVAEPDSFISHFFRDLSKGKPYLQLEIDEHSADAGAITRCEAFLDSLKHVKPSKVIPLREKLPSRTERRKSTFRTCVTTRSRLRLRSKPAEWMPTSSLSPMKKPITGEGNSPQAKSVIPAL